MSEAVVGWNSYVGLAEEVTYGTAVDATHWLPVISSSFEASLNKEPVPYLSSGVEAFHNARDHALLAHDLSGSIETVPVYDGKPFLLLLKHAMGSVSSGSGPPYDHTFLLNETSAPVALTLEQLHGYHSSLALGEVYAGCRIGSWEMEWDARSYGRFRCQIIGKGAAGMSAPTDTPTYSTAEESHGAHVGTLSWNSATLTLTRFGVRVDRNLAIRPRLGDLKTDRPQMAGPARVMAYGRMELDSYALYTGLLDDTVANGTVIVTGSNDNRVTFTLDNMLISKATKPVDRAGVLTLDWEAMLKADAAGDRGLKIVVRNANAAAI